MLDGIIARFPVVTMTAFKTALYQRLGLSGLSSEAACSEGDCSTVYGSWQWWRGGLAGGPLLVEEEEGEGRGLLVGVEVEDCVEAATPFLKVVGVSGQPEPGVDNEGAGGGFTINVAR